MGGGPILATGRPTLCAGLVVVVVTDGVRRGVGGGVVAVAAAAGTATNRNTNYTTFVTIVTTPTARQRRLLATANPSQLVNH